MEEVLELLQPKKVGRVFRPRLTKELVSGIEGKEVPFPMPVEFRLRSYVATSEVPLGQKLSVSAEESTAKMTST